MSTIEEFTTFFKNRAEKLPPIAGEPTYDNLERLRKPLSNLLHAVKLPGGTNDKSSITTESDKQASHSRITFNRLNTPLKAYNPYILSDTMTTDFMRAKHKR